MDAKYDALIRDMAAAFAGRAFEWNGGHFTDTRTHNAGSYGWPWEFIHRWSVKVPAPTRDALIRHGIVEQIPSQFTTLSGGSYRLSLAALTRAEALPSGHDLTNPAPSIVAFREHFEIAKAEKDAARGQTRTI